MDFLEPDLFLLALYVCVCVPSNPSGVVRQVLVEVYILNPNDQFSSNSPIQVGVDS